MGGGNAEDPHGIRRLPAQRELGTTRRSDPSTARGCLSRSRRGARLLVPQQRDAGLLSCAPPSQRSRRAVCRPSSARAARTPGAPLLSRVGSLERPRRGRPVRTLRHAAGWHAVLESLRSNGGAPRRRSDRVGASRLHSVSHRQGGGIQPRPARRGEKRVSDRALGERPARAGNDAGMGDHRATGRELPVFRTAEPMTAELRALCMPIAQPDRGGRPTAPERRKPVQSLSRRPATDRKCGDTNLILKMRGHKPDSGPRPVSPIPESVDVHEARAVAAVGGEGFPLREVLAGGILTF